ncbi:uncharacterized protein LOC130630304 isoform X2 [Hydractinia symbiolongicarpus]|uniref:uncharacterized protein LOC130630304 isoform X2 n=1 Tax=Hydractinia symbiolongicarpus TaxID=13093 RepID=UPI00254A171C|nr:uncharacterized protein LOC130630304 isoform X2 [Hydractinia symbiolongicarpus]
MVLSHQQRFMYTEGVFQNEFIFSASRPVQPSSPGCAKRKVQQKLQRDAKQQPRGGQGSPSLLQKQSAGSRIPNFKVNTPNSAIRNKAADESKQNGLLPPSKLKTPEQQPKFSPASKMASPLSRISHQNNRSVPRLSQKNSDTSSSVTSSNDSSSTPVSRIQSPSYSVIGKTRISPPVTKSSESIHSKVNSGIPMKSGIPSRSTSALNNKRSLDSLRMSRENTAENLKQRKDSSSSIPCTRNKQSCESLGTSRENISDNYQRRADSGSSRSSSRRSSVGSSSSDGGDVVKPATHQNLAANIPKLKPSVTNLSSARQIKQPRAYNGGVSSGKQNQKLKEPNMDCGESKIKAPSGASSKHTSSSKLIPPSKPTGILKPMNKVTVDLGANKVDHQSKTTINNHADIERENVSLNSPKGIPRRASDGTVLKNRNTSSNTRPVFEKKFSESSFLAERDSCEENKEENMAENFVEKDSLRYPTVGKIPAALSSESKFVNTKAPLRYSASTDFGKSCAKIEGKASRSQSDSNVFHTPLKASVSADTGRGIKSVQKANRELDNLNLYLEEQENECIPDDVSECSSILSDGRNSSYKLDIPSPEDDKENSVSDSISYPYNNKKFTHQNVEMIIAERIEGSKQHASVADIKKTTDGYAEPEDCLKFSNYKEPVDSLETVHGRNTESVFNHDTQQPIMFKNFIETNGHRLDSTSPVNSPFRRIHPKVIIPPPQLSTHRNEGGLPIVPKEYARTPSSDVEELLVSHTEIDKIRRKAHEQAMKTWKKNKALEEVPICEESDHLNGGERSDGEVFYPSNASEFPEPTEKLAAKTSIRRASAEQIASLNDNDGDNMYRLQTMTLDRDKKKKSKIKKFFQKLSSKKEEKVDVDHNEDGDGFRTPLRSTSSYYKDRRKSDGTISLHSIQEIHSINPTPTTKRRLFLFNLSFMKKGRRQRSYTSSHMSYDDGGYDVRDCRPSDTVRALCSPDITRRNLVNKMLRQRRGSEPSLYRIQETSRTKKYKAPLPPDNVVPFTTRKVKPRTSNSSVSSVDTSDEADYINFPFSKTDVQAPSKPQRHIRSGSTEPYSSHRSNSLSSSSTASKKSSTRLDDDEWKKDVEYAVQNMHTVETKVGRLSSNSSESSSFSSESLSSSQRSHALHLEASYVNVTSNKNNSLRRTPLRHSIDNFNKLIELHRQTIEKIAYESSRLHCDCELLIGQQWEDFERSNEMVQLGLTGYMVVPVACPKSSNRAYTAWLRLEQKQTSEQVSCFANMCYSKLTLHRNCLHICHMIEQAYSSPCDGGLPKAIQFDCVYISPQIPNMALSRYISLTLEKHARYPEIYEREIALIALQVVKGVQYLQQNGVSLTSLGTENIFVLNNGDQSVVLSPRRTPNKCPAVAIAVLPGLGNGVEEIQHNQTTSVCHQLAFLLFELLHSPYHDELRDATDFSMLLATLPDLTIKSIYSRYFQYITNLLLESETHNSRSLDDLRLVLEVLLFGPTDICDHEEDDAVSLINKWLNRRCVDVVTHILKEASLNMSCMVGTTSSDVEKIKSVDQEVLLECEFLSAVTPHDIYRISKMLNR